MHLFSGRRTLSAKLVSGSGVVFFTLPAFCALKWSHAPCSDIAKPRFSGKGTQASFKDHALAGIY